MNDNWTVEAEAFATQHELLVSYNDLVEVGTADLYEMSGNKIDRMVAFGKIREEQNNG